MLSQPGFESLYGTPRGMQAARTEANGGYEALRVETIRWAMVDMMRKPPPGFEAPLFAHFQLKRAYICRIILGWFEEGAAAKSSSHLTALADASKSLLEEFNIQFGPSSSAEEYDLAGKCRFTRGDVDRIRLLHPVPKHAGDSHMRDERGANLMVCVCV